MASGVIKKTVSGFGDKISITSFPFTASVDGVAIFFGDPTSSASDAYLYIGEDGSTKATEVSSAGRRITITMPIKKGCVYSISYERNIQTKSADIYPFA